MKKLIVFGFMPVFVLSVCALLSGCASTNKPVENPEQVLEKLNNQVCPVLQATKSTIAALPNLDADVLAKLKPAGDLVDKVCSAGAQLNATDLQTLLNSSIPVVLDVVQSTDVFPQQQAVIDGIKAAQILLPVIIAQVKAVS